MTQTFPALGHTYEANFGSVIFNMQYGDDSLTYTTIKGPNRGRVETVAAHIDELRPNVYQVSWTEADGSSVVHIEDFECGVVHSTTTQPGAVFNHMHGSLRQLV